MKAMILAAGRGTRLRPLTDDRPKALVEVAGRTMLEITITRLKQFGVREVIVNVHHFADMVISYLQAHQSFDIRIEISREENLLDTGGGLKKAAWFFREKPADRKEPFLLHNVDVISTIDVAKMMGFYKQRQPLAALAVQNRRTSRPLLFNEEGRLCGRGGGKDRAAEIVRKSNSLQAYGFCGIHIISPRIFSFLGQEGAFSIIDSYLHLAAEDENVLSFPADEYFWRDLGRPESVLLAECDFLGNLFS